MSGETITYGKKILHGQIELPIDEAYEIASKAMSENIKTHEDCKEGIKAFLEKRKPNFKN